jgi:hypothetical protein
MSAFKVFQSTEETTGNNPNKKRRGRAKQYSEILKFSDLKAAENAMKGQVAGQLWIRKYVRKNADGFKIYYACKSNPNCPKSLYISRNTNFNETSIWLCTSADHQHKENNKGPLPVKTVEFIKDLLHNGPFKSLNIFLSINSIN